MHPNFNVYIVLKTKLSHLSHLGPHHVGVPRKTFWWHPRVTGNLQLPQDCSGTSPGLSVNPNNLTPTLAYTSWLLL